MTGRFVPTAAMEGWCELILFLLCNLSWMMCGPILASTLILIAGAHTAKNPMLCRHPSLLHAKGWRPHFDDKLKCISCNLDVLPQAVPCFFEQVLPHSHYFFMAEKFEKTNRFSSLRLKRRTNESCQSTFVEKTQS